MSKPFFPQFTRLISAPFVNGLGTRALRFSTWGLLAVLLAVNIYVFKEQNTRFTNVLGTSAGAIPQELVQTENDVERRYAEWHRTIQLHPDYRDGYYMLALLAYQLNRIEESKSYLTIIKNLDPNFSGISALEALLLKE